MNESEVKSVRYRIQEIRESKGMSKTELSKRSGVTRATIWNLETHEDAVTTSTTLEAIANALGVKPGELIFSEKV